MDMPSGFGIIVCFVAFLAAAQGQLAIAFADLTQTAGPSGGSLPCSYTLTTAKTLQYIEIQRKEGSTYVSIAQYNNTDTTLYGNTRYTYDLAGGIFTLKIADLVAQDAMMYKCIVTDSSPASAESVMTLVVIDINQCVSDPCQNGGTCLDGTGLFTCTCPSCYSGSMCENQKIYECTSNPCKNGATCNDLCDKYTCSCPNNFNGTNCDGVCDNIVSVTPSKSVLLGSQVTLDCTLKTGAATGDKIYWSMNPDGSNPYANNAKSTFTMSKKMAGTHYCFAEQDGCIAFTNSTVLTYTYELFPNETSYENVTLKKGETRTFTCVASGSPIPTVQWFFVPAPRMAPPQQNGDNVTSVTTPMPSKAPAPKAVSNATLNSTTYTISSADMDDAGKYTCKASIAGGDVTVLVQVKQVTVDPTPIPRGLEPWQIALIVVGCILFVAIIIIVIVVVLWKTGKAGAICPSDRAAGAPEVGDSAPYDKRDTYSPNKKKLRTDDPRDEYEDPRPLPAPPAGSRGGTLPPLDVEAEKSKKKKKKQKKRKDEEEEEQRDSGNEYDRD